MTETLLQIKDSAHAEKPIWLARRAQGTYTWNTYYSSDAVVKGRKIPRFPDSWKTAFGPKLFQMLINWRTAAHKKASQEQLNEDFATSTVEYTARQPKQKSRRAQQTPPEPECLVTKQTTTTRHIDLEDSDNNYDVCVKKCICLGKPAKFLWNDKSDYQSRRTRARPSCYGVYSGCPMVFPRLWRLSRS